ncbi:MAG: 23S rRNA (guanosine-2'-O-)-methyltransferase RlmB [Porticoccaceae bacterium]|nr:MAG: 23S rRNA (guanosine-2'-O-)-methyltransferase RlmB [Porticoccaceae bacterium]
MAEEVWLGGVHAVAALLKTEPERIRELRVLPGAGNERRRRLAERARRLGVAVASATRAELDRLAGPGHQGVAVRCRAGAVRDEHFLLRLLEELDHSPFLLVLDGVTDPHNLGACLRAADGAGADAVVAPRDRACGLTPTVRKVACGAAESVPFVAVTNLARTLAALREQGVWVVGLDAAAPRSLFEVDLAGPVALVLGAEGEGLRRLTREGCDHLVRLPMAGAVESLNVGVAAGICLYEGVRQRLARGEGRCPAPA